jgi:HK97 family phage portal protein
MKIFDFLKRSSTTGWGNLDAFTGPESGFLSENTVLSIPAVYSCVRILSEAISSLPLITYERQPNGDKERATEFSLYRILHDSPNPLQTSLEFREVMVGNLCLRGNFYAYIERQEGEIVALWPLAVDTVTPELQGRSIVYRHSGSTGERTYQQTDILHVKGLSFDGITGLSPLALLRDTFGRAKSIADYSSSFFRNDASPSGILSTPGSLDVVSRQGLAEMWSKSHQGTKNAHKVAVLDGGLNWTPISVTPEDSQLIETMKFSVVDIARCYRVPLNLLMDYDRSTYSNVTEQNRSFLTHTLQPWLCRIEESMTKALLTESEKNRYEIEHLTASFLRADTEKRFAAYETGLRAGFLTVDEVRQLENMNKLQK